MSRIGEKEITLPTGVSVEMSGSTVKVKGGKGELSIELADGITLTRDGGTVRVERANDSKRVRALHGTMRSLVANMVEGVSNGFIRELEISGVGYRSQVQGTTFILESGFSHKIEYQPPEGVTIETPNGTDVKITGVDKQAVGQAAARIRGFCKAEPYKGKGIRYKDERIRRKVGKTVA
jgi:large subunit ribosomal protein L6